MPIVIVWGQRVPILKTRFLKGHIILSLSENTEMLWQLDAVTVS